MKVTILGAGKVGRALHRGLRGTRHSSILVPARRGLPERVTGALLVLAVRDRDVVRVARALASHQSVSPRTAVVHVAGALGPNALSSLRRRTAGVGQMHPMISFASARRPPTLRGGRVLVGGDARAVARASAVARAVGMVPRAWRRVDRIAYHAAGGLVANGSAALAATAATLLRRAGAPPEDVAPLFGALLMSVGENVLRLGLPDALTGPVRRGDDETVEAHVERIEHLTPDLLDLYLALVSAQLPLAVSLGEADPRGLERTAALVASRRPRTR